VGRETVRKKGCRAFPTRAKRAPQSEKKMELAPKKGIGHYVTGHRGVGGIGRGGKADGPGDALKLFLGATTVSRHPHLGYGGRGYSVKKNTVNKKATKTKIVRKRGQGKGTQWRGVGYKGWRWVVS